MAYHNNGIMVENIKDLIEIWDFDENIKAGLNPQTIPVNSCVVAFWKCKNGHKWKEEVSRVYDRKVKCLFCSGRLIWSGENDLQTLYPELAKEWDIEKNGITPDMVSPKDTKTYWWKCKNGHPSFLRSVEHRVTRKDTCPYCSGRKVVPGVNDLQTLFPKIASEWDYEANKGVFPNEVSPNTWKSFKWICPKGHHYPRKVYLRTHSEKQIDCPKCLKARSTSFPEQAIYYYTKQFYPDAINRYKGLSETGLELDIFIPNWNIGIEYDGKRYHSSEEAKERERRKYKICKQRHIKLIRIREGEEYTTSFEHPADQIFYIKKRPSDADMDEFLSFFFSKLTEWSHGYYSLMLHPRFKSCSTIELPVDINIKRDRPKILEYLIDVDNSFGSLHPDLAKNWDNEANGKLTPFMLPPGSNHSVFFKCEKCGKQWSAPISTVVECGRTMCKKCSMKSAGLKTTQRALMVNGSLADFSADLLEQWDEDENGKLSPYDIPPQYSKPVSWKCPVCNYKWSQSPNARIHKRGISGCPHCSGRVAMPGVDDLQTLYPDIAAEWDYEKNDGVLPSQIRPYNNTKRFWICSKHGVSFDAYPGNRVKGCGCYLCKSEKIKNKTGFKVEQYDKNLALIKIFPSINDAARNIKMNAETIRQAIINGTLTADSYWKYVGSEFTTIKPDRKNCVVGVNVKSGEIVEFESAREAERKTGISHTHIMNCCKGIAKYNTAGGFYWHFKDNDLVIRKPRTTGKPVIGINQKTNVVIEYESASEAAKHIGIGKSSISSCCKGRTKTAGGYYWKYK